jgi:acetylglutamate kinase
MSATVVKIGGALVADSVAMAEVWSGVDALRRGGDVVVVHGGGPQATALARRLGHEPRIVAGRRVTTDVDLDVALWTMRGALNARLVAGARKAGVPAVGLSGVDGGLVTVTRRPPGEVDGETVDFGHVGDIVACDPGVLAALVGAGFVPVVAPLCADAAGGVYNVNADTVALAIADALGAGALLLVARAGGVFSDLSRSSTQLSQLDGSAFDAGVRAGWITDGMRPKLEVGFRAVASGIADVRICAPAGVADESLGTRLS